MEQVTLLISLAASFLVLCLSPIYGLITYIATFALYPTYLSVPVGTIDFTAQRIVIIGIFVKLFLLTDLPKRFKFLLLDKLLIIYFLAQFLSQYITSTSSSFMPIFENRCGEILDTVLPYFAVRMIIQSRQQYLTLLKWIFIIAAPLAIIGFYECMTGTNLLGFFREYYAWRSAKLDDTTMVRYGFFRAYNVFSHPIMYGLFFAMFGPVCAGILAYVKKNKMLYWAGLGLMGIGVFSSMSSGPILAVQLSIPFVALYRWRKYWKLGATVIIIMCASVEIISNRHFYEVIDRFSFSASSAWYRSKLISVALFEGGMSGHWLFGYPFGTDANWGKLISGLDYTDIVNHYILSLHSYGLVGLIPFLAVIGAAIKRLIVSFRTCILESDRWLIWCLSSALFGILVAMNSTSLFGPPITIFYIMLAFCGMMPFIVVKNNAKPGTERSKTVLVKNHCC